MQTTYNALTIPSALPFLSGAFYLNDAISPCLWSIDELSVKLCGAAMRCFLA
jgi:hypothetical protein